jgi:hypothetical protein
LSPATAAREVGDILQGVSGSLGAGFAGAWLDADGLVHVGFAGTDGVAAARQNARLAPLVRHRAVVLVPRTFSQRELHAAMVRSTARLSSVFRTTPGHVVPSSFLLAVNVPANVVDVTISTAVRDRFGAVETALAGDVAGGLVRVRLDAVRARDLSCTRASCQPLRGGLEIESSTNYCSSGFIVKSNTGALARRGVKFLASAGHCETATWKNGGTRFGSTAWLRNAGNVDAEIITLDNPALPQAVNQIYKDATTGASVTTKVTDPSATVINTPLCKEGRTSNETCGKLIANDLTTSNDGVGHTGFGSAQMRVCQGDSGGSVVDGSNRAYGIVSGGSSATIDTPTTRSLVHTIFTLVSPPDCDDYMSFGWTADMESASGFQLMLDGATETLGSNQTLQGGQMLKSTDGRYTAEMQNDGNFVVYKPGHIAVWATNTAGNSGAYVTMQSDGNLVLYKSNGSVAFSTGTYGNLNSTLIMQPDCNLVLYAVNGTTPLWASGTQYC